MKYFIVDCPGETTYRNDSDDMELTAIQSNELTRYNQRMISVFVYDTPLIEDARNWVETTT